MSETPRVFLGMPHYGPVEFGAATALHLAQAAESVEVVGCAGHSSSLLCQAFNGLLAKALDMRDKGTVTHFAMLHADIQPGVYNWLDVLHREMRAHHLDLVSAVVPIKEPERSKTSTAVGLEDDPWQVVGYVTATDRPNLPATFTGADVCEPGQVLLVNTGCWLADLRKPWWDGFAFSIKDRIVRGEDGTRRCQTRPEDWEMSRHLHAAGARYGATWALPLTHYGQGGWPNR